MWVFRRLRQDDEVDFVAADFARERAEIRQRSDDVQFGRRGSGRGQNCEKDQLGFLHELKFVRAMRAEDEFELKKDRIDVPSGKKKVLLQEVVIVLQPEF